MTSWSDGPGPLPVDRVALVILDGWGVAAPGEGNAISLADTPSFDELWRKHQTTELTACGRAVGLPEGQMGNSEVGHLNLGAGSVVRQDLTRIDDAVEDGSLAQNEVLLQAMAEAREVGRLHLLGLVSHGGVHSSERHLEALIEMAAAQDVPDIVLHAFTDGRDTLPHSGAEYVAEAEGRLRDTGRGRVATVSGRYYAMDRDKRWTGSSSPSTRWSRARRSSTPTAARRRCAPPTSAARPTSSSCRPRSARRGAFARATRRSSSTSGPTARGR
jgi:2,3-bisphosphoglycerate-independent phosphoglycerate mutase